MTSPVGASRAYILTDGGIRVVGEASTGREAVAMVTDHTPDVVLMDIRMPDMDGIARPRSRFRSTAADGAVLVPTTFEDNDVRWRLAAQAERPTRRARSLRRYRAALSGRSMRGSRCCRLSRRARSSSGRCTAPRRRCPSAERNPRATTVREREVLILVAGGRSNQGDRRRRPSSISPHTARRRT